MLATALQPQAQDGGVLMALTDYISIEITDYTGKPKSVQLFVPTPNTIAGLQALADVTAPLLDAAVDGQITGVSATFALTIPSGMKSSPVTGNTVREGALLSYSLEEGAGTNSTYIPSWENAGFAGNTVLTTGDYDAVEDDLVQYTNRFAVAQEAFVGGVRKFRK